MVTAKTLVVGGKWSYYEADTKFLFGVMKMFWK